MYKIEYKATPSSISELADAFAIIEEHNYRVAKLTMNNYTEKNLILPLYNGFSSGDSFWGADIYIDDTLMNYEVILESEKYKHLEFRKNIKGLRYVDLSGKYYLTSEIFDCKKLTDFLDGLCPIENQCSYRISYFCLNAKTHKMLKENCPSIYDNDLIVLGSHVFIDNSLETGHVIFVSDSFTDEIFAENIKLDLDISVKLCENKNYVRS